MKIYDDDASIAHYDILRARKAICRAADALKMVREKPLDEKALMEIHATINELYSADALLWVAYSAWAISQEMQELDEREELSKT